MSNNKIASRLTSFPRYAIALFGVLSITGCMSIGKLTAVVITTPPTCDSSGNLCGTPRLDPVTIEVRGQGVCTEFKLDLGYGAFPLTERNHDFSKGPKVYQQLYFSNGYPGPKTITAVGVTNCVGTVTTSHRVFTNVGSFSEELQIGVANPTQLCYAVPSAAPRPALRKNTTVRITSPTTPKVSFGCFGGCAYDADGKPNSIAPANFPFPGLRQYSLVMKVGNQAEQAGTSATFVTNQSGDLLICQNDDLTYDNTGGWQVNIFVDESKAELK